MPTVTYDGRSFMLDGRRMWIASGSVPFQKLSRDAWADRIHSLKLCGLNTVETPVFWNRCEPRAGRLDFTGENDIRHFVKLVQAAGLHCMLRVGPFVGAGWDLGGLPAWVLDIKDVKLRAGHAGYLDACSRYLGALVEQVRDLQVSAAGKGGPLIAVQCEADWSCGDETVADQYLRELNRFLRESGLSVPILNSNNLWQSVEGQIDGWAGRDNLLATMRQLACVRADQPRIVTSFAVGERAVWGRVAESTLEPWQVQRRLAEALAGGGQFNIDPFAGGTNTGFWSGRLPDGADAFATTSADEGAPIGESGARGPAWSFLRRIATFASRFGKTLAGLDPAYQPIVLAPPAEAPRSPARKGAEPASGHSIVHAMGPQGAVVFVFAEAPQADDAAPASLLLPEGETLPIHLGSQAVAWCLFDANLSPRAHLDYTNLNAFAVVGRVFVCFGKPKTTGVLSINGSVLEAAVPAGPQAAPTLVEHEGVHVLILCEPQVDSTWLTDDAVVVGAVGLTPDGRPILPAGAKSYLHISGDGVMSTRPAAGPKSVAAHQHLPAADRVTLGEWSTAGVEDYVSGESARFATIAGPADLSGLGSPFGYGWYRLTFKNTAPRKARAAFARGGDRLHVYAGGKLAAIAGVGPEAEARFDLPLRKGTDHVVVLADNFGRFAGGAHMAERKGVADHLYEVEAIRPGAAKLVRGEPIEVLGFATPLWSLRPGDSTEPDRISWTLAHRKKTPVLIHFDQLPVRGLLLVDDKPAAYVDHSGPRTLLLDPERFSKTTALIQLAVIGDEPVTPELLKAVDNAVSFDDAAAPLSGKAEWAFAKWEPPPASAYKPAKSGKGESPRWWKTTFRPGKSTAPLFLEGAGLTKGQIYVNGRHLGRYFVAGPSGRPIPGQTRYFIPASWVKPGVENDLVLFDEHGAAPAKVRITHDPDAAPVAAAAGAPIVES